MHCQHCGKETNGNAPLCQDCKALNRKVMESSPKSKVTTLMLGFLLGMVGGHRFYVGKWATGILMLCTLGGVGIWLVRDVSTIICDKFTDNQGRVVCQ